MFIFCDRACPNSLKTQEKDPKVSPHQPDGPDVRCIVQDQEGG
jgi:hypothetical protein